ncbi:DUF4258 domain-containing protein [Nocardiopsis valliformis]|uniref:DUF4258 domain-containing protein n=1 Tax=Nocardiopsis valliformis TaxID=239974 RepID=UPI00034B47B8|nr:DUF4258 domain-containing protein [Nocardiopsis valliformis]
MKKQYPLALGVVAALLLSETAVVADERPDHTRDTLDRIDEVADGVAAEDSTGYPEALFASGRPDDMTIGSEPNSALRIPLSGGEEILIGMPAPDRARASVGASGTMLFTGDSADFSSAVRTEDGGTARLLLHIDSPSAPDEYRFDLDLPEGGELVELEDGGAFVLDGNGDMVGTVAPPWAVDADGSPLPTELTVQGDSLVQRVEFGEDTVYPVVADPFWIPALMVGARITAHAAGQMAKRKVSQKVVQQVVQNGKKTAGKGNTSVFIQGKGKNKIRVVVNNKNGNIVTVTKG